MADGRKVVGFVSAIALFGIVGYGIYRLLQKKGIVSNVPNPVGNNYVTWTLTVVAYMNNFGNADDAATLQSQLIDAWNSNGVPVYSDRYVRAIYGTLPQGLFAPPDTISTNNGDQNSQLESVYSNAIILMSTDAMNQIQSNTNGQAIGSRQSIIRNSYLAAAKNAQTISTIPETTEALIKYCSNAATGQWQAGSGGGSLCPQCTANTISQAVQVAGVAVKVAAMVA
jgi:hypothetical protein